MTTLATLFNRAQSELACPECHNSRRRQDECRSCHGELRNTATIALLGELVERMERAAQ